MNEFAGKVALVTGGASGMGRATSLLLASRGADVVVADRDKAGGEHTVGLIEERSGSAVFVHADIADASSVEELVAACVRRGNFKVAINVAGIDGPGAPTADISPDELAQVMDINAVGSYLCVKYEVAAMLKNGGGAIANTTSGAGLVGIRGLAPYTVSKHAVVGLTKVAALDYAQNGIRVNAVAPGPTETPMFDRWSAAVPGFADAVKASTPMGRSAQPLEIAEGLVWLCSDAASYVTGVILPVDGGYVAQ